MSVCACNKKSTVHIFLMLPDYHYLRQVCQVDISVWHGAVTTLPQHKTKLQLKCIYKLLSSQLPRLEVSYLLTWLLSSSTS